MELEKSPYYKNSLEWFTLKMRVNLFKQSEEELANLRIQSQLNSDEIEKLTEEQKEDFLKFSEKELDRVRKELSEYEIIEPDLENLFRLRATYNLLKLFRDPPRLLSQEEVDALLNASMPYQPGENSAEDLLVEFEEMLDTDVKKCRRKRKKVIIILFTFFIFNLCTGLIVKAIF